MKRLILTLTLFFRRTLVAAPNDSNHEGKTTLQSPPFLSHHHTAFQKIDAHDILNYRFSLQWEAEQLVATVKLVLVLKDLCHQISPIRCFLPSVKTRCFAPVVPYTAGLSRQSFCWGCAVLLGNERRKWMRVRMKRWNINKRKGRKSGNTKLMWRKEDKERKEMENY